MGGSSSTNAPSYGGQNKMTSGSPQYTPGYTGYQSQPPGGYGTQQQPTGLGAPDQFNQSQRLGGSGGGMSRGKGFRSGGAVHEISDEDLKRVLDALATARQVVKDGK